MAKSFKTPPQDPIEIVVPRDRNKAVHKIEGLALFIVSTLMVNQIVGDIWKNSLSIGN